jgi:hypothetical protein
MKNYTTNESYSHNLSKNVLKDWFNNGLNLYSLQNNKVQINRISTNIEYDDIIYEYPLALVNTFHSTFDCGCGWGYLLQKSNEFQYEPMTYVPNYDECKNAGYNPIAIIDLVIHHKGTIVFGIEICNKNPVSVVKQNKIIELYNSTHTTTPIFEIDSNWIMQQTKQPEKIIFKRQII